MANNLQRFQQERSLALNDIKQFSLMVLEFLSDMEGKKGYEHVVNAVSASKSSVISLVKSLCLIHGLYGYPADSDNTGKSYRIIYTLNLL